MPKAFPANRRWYVFGMGQLGRSLGLPFPVFHFQTMQFIIFSVIASRFALPRRRGFSKNRHAMLPAFTGELANEKPKTLSGDGLSGV